MTEVKGKFQKSAGIKQAHRVQWKEIGTEDVQNGVFEGQVHAENQQ